jgi:hypothetical protein
MPGSVTSVFGEPEDFQAALREEGVLGMLITGRGRFRARLTQITLHRLRLSAAEEHLPWIVFVAVPADAVLVLLPIGGYLRRSGAGSRCKCTRSSPSARVSVSMYEPTGPAAGAPSDCRPRIWLDMAGRCAEPGSSFLNSWRDGNLRLRLAGSCATSIKLQSAPPKLGRQRSLTARRCTGWSSN